MLRSVPLKLVALFCLASAPALADLPEILACAAQTDATARLACYDAAAAKLKAELTQAQQRKFSLFGFNPFDDSGHPADQPAARTLGPEPVDEVDAKLASSTKDPFGHLVLTLNNGQVWRIDEYRQVSLSKAKNTLVSIVRNDFGGYYMGINGDDNKLSVTRLK